MAEHCAMAQDVGSIPTYKQAKLNSENKHSKIPLRTPLAIEAHASSVYTHAIFKEFQCELEAALYKCGMNDMHKNGETDIYGITDSEIPNKTWQVMYEPKDSYLTCTCCLHQRMGVLCRHSLWVLKNKNVTQVPEDLRWTKEAMKKPIFNKKGELLDVSEQLNDRKKLCTELWEEVYSCVSVAEDNEEHMKLLIEKLRDIKVEISAKARTLGTKKDKSKDMEKYVGCSIPTNVIIKPPNKAKNKESGKRINSQLLKALGKRKKAVRYCKICGRRGHNARTCRTNVSNKDDSEDDESQEDDSEEDELEEEHQEDEDNN